MQTYEYASFTLFDGLNYPIVLVEPARVTHFFVRNQRPPQGDGWSRQITVIVLDTGKEVLVTDELHVVQEKLLRAKGLI